MELQVSHVDCVVPLEILECAGSILCVPAYVLADPGRAPETAFAHSLQRALIALLANNVGLMLVLYAADNADGVIRRARQSLPIDHQCRVIGSAVGTTVTGPQRLCEVWQRSFAPRLPFSILDEMKIRDVAAVDLNPKPRSTRKKVVQRLNAAAGVRRGPVIIRPLHSVEMVKISIEAYINGLGALALALIRPLIGYWQIQPDTIGHVLGIPKRSSADYYGELSRYLQLRFQVYAVRTKLFGAPAINLDIHASNAEIEEQGGGTSADQSIISASFLYEPSSIPGYIDQIDTNGNRITGQYVDGRFVSKTMIEE